MLESVPMLILIKKYVHSNFKDVYQRQHSAVF